MRRLLTLGCALACALFLSSPPAMAAGGRAGVSSTELLNHASYYNGRTIAFVGEVVGSPIDRGDLVWVNVSDGVYALGVLVPKADAFRIHIWGNYWQTGDTVEVTGTFYRADPRTGGETDIRASSLVVIRSGHLVAHPVSPLLFGATLVAVALAAFLYLLDRRAKRRNMSAS